jgi:hypothetical protein
MTSLGRYHHGGGRNVMVRLVDGAALAAVRQRVGPEAGSGPFAEPVRPVPLVV